MDAAILSKKTPTPNATPSRSKAAAEPDAQGALNLALSVAQQRRDDPYGPPVTASDWALISIAASLAELAKRR